MHRSTQAALQQSTGNANVADDHGFVFRRRQPHNVVLRKASILTSSNRSHTHGNHAANVQQPASSTTLAIEPPQKQRVISPLEDTENELAHDQMANDHTAKQASVSGPEVEIQESNENNVRIRTGGISRTGMTKSVDSLFHFKVSTKRLFDQAEANAQLAQYEHALATKSSSVPSDYVQNPGLSRLSSHGVREYTVLPDQDDPSMIDKERLLRTKEGDGARRRRSSVGVRGKRVTQSTSGSIFAPHSDIAPESFYRHIDADMSDPNRLAQLLTWCGKYLLDTEERKKTENANNGASSTEDEVQDAAFEQILSKVKTEFVNSLANKTLSVSWYNRDLILEEDTDAKNEYEKANVLPHPQNEENQLLLVSYSKDVARLETEQKQWLKLVDEHNETTASLRGMANDEEDDVQVVDEVTKVLIEHDLGEEGRSILKEYCPENDDPIKDAEKWVAEQADSLRFDISNLEHVVNVASTFHFRTSRFVEKIFAKLVEERKKEQEKIDPLNILRSLSVKKHNGSKLPN